MKNLTFKTYLNRRRVDLRKLLSKFSDFDALCNFLKKKGVQPPDDRKTIESMILSLMEENAPPQADTSPQPESATTDGHAKKKDVVAKLDDPLLETTEDSIKQPKPKRATRSKKAASPAKKTTKKKVEKK